jgi:limonene-1,2-epoxide hydrolase
MGDTPIIEPDLKFDPDSTWAPLEERIAREKNPRLRQLLQQVRDHMQTEIQGDLEALMNTLSDEPNYHFWGVEMDAPKGRAAVRVFYDQMISTGGNRFHFRIHRVVVDEDSVVTEGTMRQRVPGAAVTAFGIEEVEGRAVEPEADYLAESQILTVWPADAEGRILGEDIYFGSPIMAHVTRLP